MRKTGWAIEPFKTRRSGREKGMRTLQRIEGRRGVPRSA
jgi:hypothetical protein